MSNIAIEINIRLPWALWLELDQFLVFLSLLEIICVEYNLGLAEWTNYDYSIYPIVILFSLSARATETVAVKLSLWKSSDAGGYRLLLSETLCKLSKIVTRKGISCGRKGLCVFGQAAWEFWYNTMDQCQEGTASTPQEQAKTLQYSGTVPSLHPRRSASD